MPPAGHRCASLCPPAAEPARAIGSVEERCVHNRIELPPSTRRSEAVCEGKFTGRHWVRSLARISGRGLNQWNAEVMQVTGD